MNTCLCLYLDARTAAAGVIRELGEVLQDHRGNQQLLIHLETSQGWQTLCIGTELSIDAWDPELREEVEALGFAVYDPDDPE